MTLLIKCLYGSLFFWHNFFIHTFIFYYVHSIDSIHIIDTKFFFVKVVYLSTVIYRTKSTNFVKKQRFIRLRRIREAATNKFQTI